MAHVDNHVTVETIVLGGLDSKHAFDICKYDVDDVFGKAISRTRTYPSIHVPARRPSLIILVESPSSSLRGAGHHFNCRASFQSYDITARSLGGTLLSKVESLS